MCRSLLDRSLLLRRVKLPLLRRPALFASVTSKQRRWSGDCPVDTCFTRVRGHALCSALLCVLVVVAVPVAVPASTRLFIAVHVCVSVDVCDYASPPLLWCDASGCIDTWLGRSVLCPMCKADIRNGQVPATGAAAGTSTTEQATQPGSPAAGTAPAGADGTAPRDGTPTGSNSTATANSPHGSSQHGNSSRVMASPQAGDVRRPQSSSGPRMVLSPMAGAAAVTAAASAPSTSHSADYSTSGSNSGNTSGNSRPRSSAGRRSQAGVDVASSNPAHSALSSASRANSVRGAEETVEAREAWASPSNASASAARSGSRQGQRGSPDDIAL